MKIGIIAAMPQELKILVEALEKWESICVLEKVYYTGSIGRHEVVLLKVVSKSHVCYEWQSWPMILRWKPLSMVGFCRCRCTGRWEYRPCGQLAYHDVDVTAFGYKYGQMAGQPLTFESSHYFVSEMKKFWKKKLQPHM